MRVGSRWTSSTAPVSGRLGLCWGLAGVGVGGRSIAGFFAAATAFAAVFDVFPVTCPAATPLIGATAGDADFFGERGFGGGHRIFGARCSVFGVRCGQASRGRKSAGVISADCRPHAKPRGTASGAEVVCVRNCTPLLSTFSSLLSMAGMPSPPLPRPLSPCGACGGFCVFDCKEIAHSSPRPWKG